jgi:hypothetical protein
MHRKGQADVKLATVTAPKQSPSAKKCTVSPYPSKKNRDRAANAAKQSAPPEGIAGRERIARDDSDSGARW